MQSILILKFNHMLKILMKKEDKLATEYKLSNYFKNKQHFPLF